MNRVHKRDYRVIRQLLTSLDCARALTVLILLDHEEYSQIVSLGFNPLHYNSEREASDALQATDLLRKSEELPTGIDLDSVAYSAFFEAESVCKLTNDRFFSRDLSPADASRIFYASRKIATVLGDFSCEEFVDSSGWGPGVTLSLRGRNATTFNKFRHDGEITCRANRFISKWFSLAYPTWTVKPRLFEGNRVITVPKNAKTNRVIAVEPSLNLWFQKGIGSMIRSRLLKNGIDLTDQSHNQRLARLGSKYGSLATVDFSAASDTISYSLVLELLPFHWFEILDIFRSPRGIVCGNLIEYEKFSSMGNGFTFELESLIFWALALACVPEDHPERSKVSIYGDDLIIPADCLPAFEQLCSTCGFKVNTQKSYSNTYYRESCGKHYWNGVDITPAYKRRQLRTDQDIMVFHNELVRRACRGYYYGRDIRYKPACGYLMSITEKAKDCLISEGYGDGGFICNLDHARPSYRRRQQDGWRTKQLIFKPSVRVDDGHNVLLARLWKRSVSMSFGNEEHIPRVGRYKIAKLIIPAWHDLGPWI
jgi:hypothetical protein